MSDGYHDLDEVQQRSYDAHIMRRLLRYVRPYRGWMLFAFGLLMVVAVTSNFIPLLIMRAVDSYLQHPETHGLTEAKISANMQGLLWTTMVLAGLVLLEAALRYVQLLIVAVVGQKTMLEMRVGLFAHVQRMSLSFLDRHPVGRLMSRVTNDVEKIQQTIVTGTVQIASDLLTLVVVLVFMLAINWQLALVALLPMPLILVASALFRKYAHQSFLEIRRKLASVSAYMQECVSGMRVLQLFGQERESFAEFDRRNADHRDEWFRQVRNFAIYFPVIDFLSVSSMSLVILYCGVQYLYLGEAATGVASVGTLFGFVFWSQRFFEPIRALADRYNLLLEAMASSERIFQLLDTPEDIKDQPEALEAAELRGAVEFDGVYFTYGQERMVLEDISLQIAPGERVAIVGHTGAGKSTLINLLARFYDVSQGSIRIDGIDVRGYAQAALRRQIGIVLQDVFLFNDTVEANIRLGNEALSEAFIHECAEYVNAAKFIHKLPGGYAYRVGERGCNLSTGQRQLLAFARTLAHAPRILVLDEATSSVDTETEGLIQDAINKLLAGRTAIVIAHRLSTIQHCDRIVLMHHGRIREMGAHQELLAQGGLYRTLYELQYKDQAVG